jgi:hypothetical protein
VERRRRDARPKHGSSNSRIAKESTAREAEAIREIGLVIAIAVREVGAMLVNVGLEQTYAADSPSSGDVPSPGVPSG